MTAMHHVYLTAHGSFNSGPYLGEAAQIGVRLCFVPTATAPVMGETFEIPSNGDVATEYGTASGTNGTLTKTWKARVGAVGSTANWDASAQIAAAEATRTFLNAVKPYQAPEFSWKTVKQAAIGADGKTLGTQSIYTFSSPLVGSGSPSLPAQVALAVTLRANIMGRTGRGRFYLPALATALSTGGSLGTTMGSAVRTATKAWVDALQAVNPGAANMMPLWVITSAGKPTGVRPVEIRTGQLLDTVKSRRAQVDEVYTSLAL